jgi:cyanate lyase
MWIIYLVLAVLYLSLILTSIDTAYLNPNERKVNERIKSDVCMNRFYEQIGQKAAIYEYLYKRFGTGVMVVYSMTLD